MSASPPPVPDAATRHPKAPPIPPWPGVEVLEDRVVWAERFALQRIRFRYTRFDGTPSGTLTWELWRRGQGVVILPYDPATDRVALIEQFRLPALAAADFAAHQAAIAPFFAQLAPPRERHYTNLLGKD